MSIDLSSDTAGIKSPNPFWLASVAYEHRLPGDARVRRGLGRRRLEDDRRTDRERLLAARRPHLNGQRLIGLNNIELITDRPPEINFEEIREVKKRYPKHAVIASLMVESKREVWHKVVKQTNDSGATASSSISAARTA
jgi:dihydropyrimidine dehydrogenase (NAD+) subunit PreA